MISPKVEGVVYVSRSSISVDEDVTWILREAARGGFTPSAFSVAEFAKSLASKGWLYELEAGPTWVITESGRTELARLTSM